MFAFFFLVLAIIGIVLFFKYSSFSADSNEKEGGVAVSPEDNSAQSAKRIAKTKKRFDGYLYELKHYLMKEHSGGRMREFYTEGIERILRSIAYQAKYHGYHNFTEGVAGLRDMGAFGQADYDLIMSETKKRIIDSTGQCESKKYKPPAIFDEGPFSDNLNHIDLSEEILRPLLKIKEGVSNGELSKDMAEDEQLRMVVEIVRKSKTSNDKSYQLAIRVLVSRGLLDRQYVALADNIYESL